MCLCFHVFFNYSFKAALRELFLLNVDRLFICQIEFIKVLK